MSFARSERSVQEGKFFAIISYISFLCIVSLILKKENNFSLYHAKQGLVLFVIETVSFILSVIPLWGWIFKNFALALFMLVSLWGIYQAAQGRCRRIPIISQIADKIII
jgi:uncharacterized membrane protein